MLIEEVFFLGNTPGAGPRPSVVLPPTQAASPQAVFADAILEGSFGPQKRNPLKWAVSLGAHVGVLILLLLMPLYFSQGLNMQRLNLTLLVAPLPPAAARPPPPTSAAPRVVHAVPKTFTPGKLTAPSFVPKAVVTAPDAAVPEEAFVAVPGGVPGGMAGGQIGGRIGGIISGVASPAAPALAGGP